MHGSLVSNLGDFGEEEAGDLRKVECELVRHDLGKSIDKPLRLTVYYSSTNPNCQGAEEDTRTCLVKRLKRTWLNRRL
jgi:hypothetical protein